MDTTDGLLSLTPQREIIPGYRLEERLGVGGYGEVWSVSDPQGGKKAVKVFHGKADDERSARELRALKRAVELNHPHVLKVERVELVGGHAIALMELAEGTLRERFEQCRSAGLPGIPRDELLVYMNQAADALDYLFHNALLAHLDVKPENLLLVGGQVRIGDFGLVKHLEESNISHVGGMTPRYTAPEVFEGRPTRHSDQYSLAIVYQEMLSGRLPFAGSHMAALASQHLTAAPQLDGLEPLERFAVGKALSKNPHHRFTDCRRFVDRLMRRSSATLVTSAQDDPHSRGVQHSVDYDDRHDGHTIEVALPKIVSLPRIDVGACDTFRRPTVFIGIGGFGGTVLAKLRQLLADRVGGKDQLPAIQLLYIDTDPDAIQEVSRGSGDAVFSDDEIAFAPLRPSQHYRDSVVSSLDSISRRWFYNVPRTLRTSGMRALGRLALLDNFPAIHDALRKAISTAVDPSSLTTTSEHTKWPMVECDPRVFVVTAVTGGTGSGMLVDMGYAVRQVLAELGLADDDVSAILAYGQPRSTANGLPQANTYACLRELQYFGQPGCDYPGELACGMAGFREAGPTFSSTYLVTESDDTASPGCESLADDLALYLYVNAATACGPVLDECRRLKLPDQRATGTALRTAGITTLADTSNDDPARFAEAICRQVVRKWKIGTTAAMQEESILATEADQLSRPTPILEPDAAIIGECEARANGINAATLISHIDAAIEESLGTDRNAFWSRMYDDADLAAGNGKSVADKDRAACCLEEYFGAADSDDAATNAQRAPQQRLAEMIASVGSRHGIQSGKETAAWIIGLVNTKDARVHGALQAAQFFERAIRVEMQDARRQLADAQAAAESSRVALVSVSGSSGWLRRSGTKNQKPVFIEYAEALRRVAQFQGLAKGLSACEAQITAAADAIREHWKSLTQFAGRFRALPACLANASDEAGKSQDRIAACYHARRAEIVERLDAYCEAHLLSKERPLSQALASAAAMGALADDMLTAARRVILGACRDTDNQFLARVARSESPQQLDTMIRQSLHAASPDLLRVGGGKRLVVMAPRESYVNRLCYSVEAISNDELALCVDESDAVMVCYEGEDISWDGVESMLMRQRPDCAEMAERLHTRVNIDWTARPVCGTLVNA